MNTTRYAPFDFTPASHPQGLRVPKGTRLLQIGSTIVRVPGDAEESTRIFVHPDDLPQLRAVASHR